MHYGVFPDSHLQTLHMLMMGKTTGRRSGEILYLAATSWGFTLFVSKKDGKSQLRGMQCTVCYKKGDGIGQYPVNFVEPKQECTEVNLVVITLLLLERKKIIKSAIAVYEGQEQLAIDPNVFETTLELERKLDAATKTMKGQFLAKLIDKNDKDDNDESCLPEAVGRHVRELDKEDNKIPFYTVCRQCVEVFRRRHDIRFHARQLLTLVNSQDGLHRSSLCLVALVPAKVLDKMPRVKSH
jgi:hypothetical protein